ncbi:12-oxophytodienoate reductase [Altericroceibacterium endophyticum]|uniref:12-oxophytodienoate reductase n=1 Tax=Altericroceibacterium endophyticum TaxID=1808508 RepID=A0A6I4T9K8_9SPHN|nr:12-oxophytodienoate reductase [Altericroceibacterium endophyticum]MXO66693.1 12-oxophytodienoate reductase [Altericroceibacterium endophyticum]
MNMRESRLFEPFEVRGMKLANRFVLPGMQRGWSVGGAPTSNLIDYYVRRVRGGVGLLITESVAVDHPSATRGPTFSRLNRETLEAWRTCIAAVHDAGGKIMPQLWHEGAIRKEEEPGSGGKVVPTLSPSGLMKENRPRGRAATKQELEDIRRAFVTSAQLAQEVGADGVELHGAHGYFLDQCLWHETNQRDDEFGGPTLAHRARYPASIARAVREACGDDFVISFRFSQWKEIDLNARIAETVEDLGHFVSILRDVGVDLLHVSTRRFWEPAWPHSDKTMSRWAKELSGLPVIAVGSVGLSSDIMETAQGVESEDQISKSVALLEAGILRGDFDLIAVGRGLISDPEWVSKVREERFEDIIRFERSHIGRLDGETDHMEGVAPKDKR